MGAPLTARRLAERVRRVIQDVGSSLFDDHELLETASDVLPMVWDRIRRGSNTYGMDSVTILESQFTPVEVNRFEVELPGHVGDIKQVEMLGPNGSLSGVLPSQLQTKSSPFLRGGLPTWFRSGFENNGKLSIVGAPAAFQARIWFQRQPTPIHYGRTASTGDSAIQLDLTGSPPAGTQAGRVERMDDLYIGTQVFIDGDPNVAGGGPSIGQVRRVTDYDGATYTCTLDTPLPGALTATTLYSLVVPLEDQFFPYFIHRAAQEIVSRAGSPASAIAMEARLARVEAEFDAACMLRDSGNPPRIVNSRR